VPRHSVVAALVLASALLGVSSPLAAQPALPPVADRTIDFTADVAPILKTSCARCHARGRDKGGFSIETRERLLKGGDNGPAVISGDSGGSELVRMVAGLDPESVMPQKGSRLTAAQVGVLRAWIDQGLAWDPAISFAKTPPRNLDARAPELPPGEASANPVDRLLAPYFAAHEDGGGGAGRAGRAEALPHGDAERRAEALPHWVDERTFARRVYLDAIGVLPAAAAVDAFVADRRPGKHARLVRALLADDRRYAEHWLSFWNDLLRNDYQGTGYIDGGREQISSWLYAALANNIPYDRFVASLVSARPGAQGFTKGIVWRGVVNASQAPEMQAAQNVSQVFMGVNLKCASCHDSFINDWQLADAYGLAGVFADGPLEMVECDRPTGKTAPLRFLYPQLGAVDAGASRTHRMAQLATLLVEPGNGRLSRTIVNRLWARFMGRGLVEPVDDMDQPAWNPDLLDWLATDLVAHRYDLKRTMAVILTSSAYRRAAVDDGGDDGPYVFRSPAVKRMSAEQFVDAVASIAGVWPAKPAGTFDFALVPAHARPAGARTRASLVAATPLMTALGRPNREQVVTTRATAPTTLQALELSNGGTLASMLAGGGRTLVAAGPTPTGATTTRLFRQALGRRPTAAERALATAQFGPTLDATEIEDLLWSIVMLPEFQIVR
jgi:cytochrome c553